MKKVMFFNPMPGGAARTIKEQYYKTSKANFMRNDSLGATGVIEVSNENIHRHESGGGRQQNMPEQSRQDTRKE